MDFGDVMKGMFPLQAFTTEAAMDPQNSMMGMATSPFAVGGGGQGMGSGGALMGLAGLVDQYGAMQGQQQPQANQFQTQTPGAPSQPGRIDQTSFGGQGMQPIGTYQGGGGLTPIGTASGQQQMDPLAMLEANIMRRSGGQ